MPSIERFIEVTATELDKHGVESRGFISVVEEETEREAEISAIKWLADACRVGCTYRFSMRAREVFIFEDIPEQLVEVREEVKSVA